MKSISPKISAIMPFYNRERYLDATIKSVLEQTFVDFELIAIDDHSTDNSLEIVNSYAKKDPRIRVVTNKKNRGISYSRNKGLELAQSEIIAVVDSDDVNMPERFAAQYDFLMSNPDIGIVGSHAHVIDQHGEKTGETITYLEDPEKLSQTFFHLGPFLQPTTMMRKSEVMRIGAYREKYTLIDDMDMYYRFFMQSGRGANMSQYLLNYRRHLGGTGVFVKKKRDLMFKLKKEMVRTYHPKMGLKDYMSMYVWHVLWAIVPEQVMVCFEQFIKKMIYR